MHHSQKFGLRITLKCWIGASVTAEWIQLHDHRQRCLNRDLGSNHDDTWYPTPPRSLLNGCIDILMQSIANKKFILGS
ncbi:hypothetical protein NPIL_262561 [Nephila pilipes]|uniref:Uncharacterized protein n=1 Tax=Nephila pilipes TaxID=299642 RepID=A0A8X6PQM1_NEPPI|nr:hypothetical protein NPIL_262561 [Nephila pilipes]